MRGMLKIYLLPPCKMTSESNFARSLFPRNLLRLYVYLNRYQSELFFLVDWSYRSFQLYSLLSLELAWNGC